MKSKFTRFNPFFFGILILSLLIFPTRVLAQDQSDGPVYVVQPGDTLYSIALRFGVTVNDLISANSISDPNQVNAGTELVLPGLKGVTGKLVTETIPLGMDLSELVKFRGLDETLIIRLNRITSPSEVYAGSNLILPQADNPSYRKPLQPPAEGSAFLHYAALSKQNPWEVILASQETSSAYITPGENLVSASSEETPPSNPLSPLVSRLEMEPMPLVQGHTTVIKAVALPGVQLEGNLNGYPLHFMQSSPGNFIALQGIHAMADPGLAPLSLRATDESGNSLVFSQMVLLQQGFYAQDPPLTVDPATIDPANTQPEDELVRQRTTPVTPEKFWTGIFRLPVDEPYCIKSWFGNRRSYNGGSYSYFHTGLDFGVCASLNIYAPAPGVVVFAGPLTVRGNATIIDHGWGVYSGFWHQEQIQVKEGDRVETGQLIGLIGGTGRVTGPHLHWEVWVNGVQVEPQDWLDREFP